MLAHHLTDCISHRSDSSAPECVDNFTGVNNHLTNAHFTYFTRPEKHSEPSYHFIIQALECTFYTFAFIFPGAVVKNKSVIALIDQRGQTTGCIIGVKPSFFR